METSITISRPFITIDFGELCVNYTVIESTISNFGSSAISSFFFGLFCLLDSRKMEIPIIFWISKFSKQQ